MRRARESAGLSLRGLGERIVFPYGFLGRVERGEQPATDGLVRALDTFYKTDGLFAELLLMAQELAIPAYGRDFVRREREALRIQVFTSSLVPGLLQTRDYARELFRTSLPWESDEEVEARVDFRVKRQLMLEREEPPFYWAIMDEAALKRPTISRATMREQVTHILTTAARPHVVVQVLPFAQAMHPMLGGSLTLLSLKDGGTVANIESFDSGEAVDSPRRLATYVQRLDVVRAMALPENESLDLLRSYRKEYEDEGDS
ncbi:helix-turn-helix domain-containing protein [Streptomyces johnsoniae]|uniref:Helix-turn-helix transcriptional regulator n=1 Tax=Streptomyces johnsoniae TaxID=3075532 RepID=A0ABU2RXX8_9ACTN|nr:helix-turn-helix transcriptional regulator [Streptomyces sp. DSM 41886]MDT0441271.1 helix-turn-helix transcriptional regulator [Streptomyces sp. DSM 41886]